MASKNKTCVAATATHNKFIAYTLLHDSWKQRHPCLLCSADRYLNILYILYIRRHTQ